MDEADPRRALVPLPPEEAGALVPRPEDALASMAQLHDEIDEARDQIRANLELLRDGVDAHYNPRTWIEDNPWEAVAVAFAIGLYVGLR